MSSYLITCTPAHGHVMPLLQIARYLVARGHEVSFLTSVRYAEQVSAAGARFVALPAEADIDLDDADAAFPERVGLTGPAALRFDMSNLFVRPGAAQLAAVRVELAAGHIDAVLTEPLFVGGALSPKSERALPAWWPDLDGTRPVVHVTQGTIANSDFGQIVLPTIIALAASDVLVVVSTGGRPADELPSDLPGNVRVAEYLPYDRLLPLVDVIVTNGGYGGVQQALSHGVPIVVAGQTEDKVEVSARVGWSGAGVNLRASTVTPAQVAGAVEKVLQAPAYRANAERIGAAMRETDALGALENVLDASVRQWTSTQSSLT